LDKETEGKLCLEIKSNMSIQLLNKIPEEDQEENHHTVNSSY